MSTVKSVHVVALTAVGVVVSSHALAQRGGGGGAQPSELRSVPAETLVALYNDPEWEPPRTSWGDPLLAGQFSVDDMRGVPTQRDARYGTEESVSEEEFLARARGDQGNKNAAASTEAFLRNEYGVRTFGWTSLIVDPPDGRMPATTDAGSARAAATRGRGTFGSGPFDDFDDFSLYDRCVTRGIFGSVLPSIYGNGIRIAQSPNSVSITYEMIHDTRVIEISNAPHIDAEIEQYMGNARGHWEGDALVVESRNFTDKTSAGGAPHSTNLVLRETYRRVDPEMIEYTATVNDPDTYEAPFTYRVMFTTQPNYEVWEYSCHEGNSAVGGSLSGERAFERQVAEAIAKGEQPPQRGGSMSVYGAPPANAEVFDINAGE
jgi:hypothetical protein